MSKATDGLRKSTSKHSICTPPYTRIMRRAVYHNEQMTLGGDVRFLRPQQQSPEIVPLRAAMLLSAIPLQNGLAVYIARRSGNVQTRREDWQCQAAAPTPGPHAALAA